MLHAAIEEFLDKGYGPTAIDSVARRAGVSTKTIYRLVGNKADLFRAMVMHRINQTSFARSAPLPAAADELPDSLTLLLVDCASLILDPTVVSMTRLVMAESGRFPEIAKIMQAGHQRVVASLSSWLSGCRARNLLSVGNTQAAAGMLIGMMVYELQRGALHKLSPPANIGALKKRAAVCTDLFLQGCASR